MLSLFKAAGMPVEGNHWPPVGAPVARLPVHVSQIADPHGVKPVAVVVCDTRPS